MLQDDRRVPRGFNEAASRGQRIPAFDVLNPAGANENFNEAASPWPADTTRHAGPPVVARSSLQ